LQDGLVQSLIAIALPGAMFALMFAMGLSLSSDDFRRIARNPRATLVGTILQLLVMPLVSLGLAMALDMPTLLAAGLVVIGACPGGMFSNMYVHLARGNTALSITLTATATLVTLFTLPLWVRLAVSTFSADGSATLEMPILGTALRLGTMTVLPVAVGMWARPRWPTLLRFERRVSIAAAIVIVIGVAAEGTSRPDVPPALFLEGAIAAAWFAISALLIGVSLPTLLRISTRDTVTIAVELIVKNTLLGIVLVSQVLDFEAVIPIFGFALFQAPTGIALLVTWKALERRGFLLADPDVVSAEVASALARSPAPPGSERSGEVS
jgi:BASS family bile acid:Na+ symporter